MKKVAFIFIDSGAAEDLVSRHGMQSHEFEEGQMLGVSLQNANPVQRRLSPTTYLVPTSSGFYLLDERSDHRDFLVIDLAAAPIFDDCTPHEAITRFQKLLRFARRRWEKVSPSHSEVLLPGSSKGVLFPNPITTQSSVRITIELSPDKTSNQSGQRGMEFLVYRIGTDEGGGANEVAPLDQFNTARAELSSAVAKLADIQRDIQDSSTAAQITSLSISRLSEGTIRGSLEGLTFDEWNDYLTDHQKEFINSPLLSPYRIEGPAGTGKTLSLVLKCIAELRNARAKQIEHRALFVAHSAATKRQIEAMFSTEAWLAPTASLMSLQSLKITTLHELCCDLLRYEISETELLDKDAYGSKQSQQLYAVEAVEEVMKDDLASHRPHLSQEFSSFLDTTDSWSIAEMIQQEISVVIKGRAAFDLERYQALPRLTYGLPVKSAGDKAFAFLIFKSYERRLKAGQQFDTDDVVLSTIQQLSTPIWRRRREKEGFDSIFVDETHLFNINELSTFHRVVRRSDSFPIAYTADVSQSLGDRGWSDVSFDDALIAESSEGRVLGKTEQFSSIFRCAPAIVDLAFSVTSSGAALFTNFHDPLKAASSAFTYAEEAKCRLPDYVFLSSDQDMINAAFEFATGMASELQTSRGNVAIIVFGNELFGSAERIADELNKPVDILRRRGDMELVKRARSHGQFVLTMPEFVGGLEFDGVILVGVDGDRVPPKLNGNSTDSENFLNYSAHQKLYVAITRARYRVSVLGVTARGVSAALECALANGLIEKRS